MLESIEFIPGNPTALLKVVLAAELVLCELHQFAMSSAGCGEGLMLAGRAKFEPHWPCPSSGTPVVWARRHRLDADRLRLRQRPDERLAENEAPEFERR